MSTAISKIKSAVRAFDLKVRSYSGRGMYGRQCLGIDIGRMNSHEFVANLVRMMVEEGTEETDRALDALQSKIETDSMGLGKIIYFPNVEWQQ